MKQYATLEATMYFWFAANDTSGSGGDGATPLVDVRLAGAAVGAIPVLSPTPILLTHANYPAGCYEVAIAATAANGFAINNTYAVFCTLAIDSQNPTGFIGSFDLKPVEANAKQLGGTSQTGRDIGANVLLSPGSGAGQLDFTSGVVKSNLVQILGTALTETAGYIAAGFKKLFNVATPLLVASDVMRGTDNAATEAKQDIIDTNIDQIETAVITNAVGVDIATDIIALKAETVLIVEDTNELQTDDIPGTLATIDTLVDRILDATEIRRGAVVDASATTTKFITNLTEVTNDFWNRMAILFINGQNDGQMRRIKDYVGGTKEITIQTPLSFAPANADTFIICTVRAFITPDIEDIADTIFDELTAGHVVAGSFGKIISEINQSLNGAKVVIDRAASTFKVYDTDGETLMFTITKATVGSVDTLTRT